VKRFNVTLITGTEPVTLDKMKSALRVTSTGDDAFLTDLIKEAREVLELYTGRAIIAQNITESLDLDGDVIDKWRDPEIHSILQFSPDPIILANPPVRSISQVRVFDTGNVSSVYSATAYRLDNSDPKQYSRLVFNYGASWPSFLRRLNAVEIDYLAGYLDGSVPSAMIAAIRALTAYCYMNRVPCSDSCIVPSGAAAAISQYKIIRASA
jgi:uncharacterized phiE125 gp8 family phage protein